MEIRTLAIGVFALVFGMAAAGGAYLLAQRPATPSKPETVSVVVAAADIDRGQTLAPEHLELRDWPKALVPEEAIVDRVQAIDRTVRVALSKGDLLSEAKLAGRGAGRGMAAIIPTGMRAITIQTPNVASGVAGFVLPGNKVDVLLTVSSAGANDSTGGGSTILLLQNVEILAVDQHVDAPQDNKMDSKELRSVTLLVTPSGAARIDLGQNKGTLRLALRSPHDALTTFVEPTTLAGLKIDPNPQRSAQQAPVQPRAWPSTIRTMRGINYGYVVISAPRRPAVPPTAEASTADHVEPIDRFAAVSDQPLLPPPVPPTVESLPRSP